MFEVDQTAVGQFAQMRLPDALGVFPFQRWVVERHMYAGLESLIEHAHSVTCEEEDTFVVLKNSEEDCYWRDEEHVSDVRRSQLGRRHEIL